MCGIIAVCGEDNACDILIKGLSALEYRGYDSAGVAVIDGGKLRTIKTVGKVAALAKLVSASKLKGSVGIAHTRWATHGKPTDENAHPHETESLVLVHNGVIENFAELKKALVAEGYSFKSQTDTEVLAVLIQSLLDKGKKPEEALRSALGQVRGTYALEVIFKSEPDRIYGAKLGSPLAIGTNGRAYFMGSDALALGHSCDKIMYLEEGDTVVIEKKSCRVKDKSGATAAREFLPLDKDAVADKCGQEHFMLKEILEQPAAIAKTLAAAFPADGAGFPIDFSKVSRIHIVACGTSYYAGLVAKYWIESMSPVLVEVEFASEFRYRRPFLRKGGVAIFISQSGETADTLAALRYAKENHQKTIAIVNVESSTMSREADVALITKAGPEIGVASTKAFTAQLALLAALSLQAATASGSISAEEFEKKKGELMRVPGLASQVLALDEGIKDIVKKWILGRKSAIYIGRGYTYPIGLEGALKLKEISYMNAEGYSAGELKHGPIALVAPGIPTVVLAPYDAELFEKTISNMHEVKARGGFIILISNSSQCEKMKDEAEATIPMPETDGFIEPLLYALPVQMLAYHTAVMSGYNVDQPRNLAKSVTVE